MNIVILPHFLLYPLAVTLCIVMSGYGSSTAQPVAISEISASQSFSEERTIWTLKPSMEVADEAALTRFFASQPDFQGSNNLQGRVSPAWKGTSSTAVPAASLRWSRLGTSRGCRSRVTVVSLSGSP